MEKLTNDHLNLTVMPRQIRDHIRACYAELDRLTATVQSLTAEREKAWRDGALEGVNAVLRMWAEMTGLPQAGLMVTVPSAASIVASLSPTNTPATHGEGGWY